MSATILPSVQNPGLPSALTYLKAAVEYHNSALVNLMRALQSGAKCGEEVARLRKDQNALEESLAHLESFRARVAAAQVKK